MFQTEIHTDDGLIDYGPDKGFAVLNDTNKLSATSENSIIVPLGTVCGSQEVSHVFFTIYRHQKLFSGPQKYRSYGGEDTEPISESFSKRDKRHVVLNEDDADTISQIPAPSRCTRQVSIPPVPVMSATLMAGDTVVKTFAAQDDSRPGIIAKLQFNTGKVIIIPVNYIIDHSDPPTSPRQQNSVMVHSGHPAMVLTRAM